MTAQQLRKSILQMAVQGKLVPQDPSDEPAHILLERIRAEKERLIKEKKIKKEKNPSVIYRGTNNLHYEKFADGMVKCIEDEIPFEIPESWGWVRLGDVGIWGAGATPSRAYPEFYDGTIPWLKTGDLTDTYITSVPENISQLALEKTSVRINPVGSVLIAMYGATIGKLGILTFPATTNQACCACAPLDGIEELYLFYFLMSQRAIFIKRGEGGAQPNISKEKIVSTLMPLPPLSEQKRILNRLNELFPLVENYGLIYDNLQKMEKIFPYCLKKSILQWAVQGKLVQQDENDEPASILLERIRAEKEELFKQGKLKKDKHESVIFRRDNSYYERLDGVERCIDDEIPFEIPKSWEWVRLMEICTYIQRGKSPEYSPIKKYPVIAQKCIQWSGFSIESAKFIKPNSIQTYAKERLLEDNDLMWNSTGLGSLGRIGIYKSNLNPFELAVTDSHVTVIRPFKRANLSKYLYYYFSNPSVQNVIEDSADGSTKQKELATTTIKTYLVPIPNLLEQHRIVNKVEDLLKLIKTL